MVDKNPFSASRLPHQLFLCFLATCFFISTARAQEKPSAPRLSFSAVADVFYTYDFNEPATGFRQPFLYNHNRHNEFNLNLGLIRAVVAHEKYRAAIGLQAGTYAQDNYAAEQELLQHVFEAYAGISLNKQNNLWLDAGIFASHIGFESAISSENWTPTRSMLAENSPYFLSGAKLTYSPATAWTFTGLLANGWQRIQRVPGNSFPSIGTQVQYEGNDRLSLNWSTFIGTDDPDSLRLMRYFNNIYGKFQLSNRLGLIAGFDLGIQQSGKGSREYVSWYSPVLIARYLLNEQWATAFRAELYSDRESVIIPAINSNPFSTSGLSANIGYQPAQAVMWRLEGRWFHSPDRIFQTEDGSFTRNNFFISSTLTVAFGS